MKILLISLLILVGCGKTGDSPPLCNGFFTGMQSGGKPYLVNYGGNTVVLTGCCRVNPDSPAPIPGMDQCK